ncbi:hypothetical protein TNCV_1394031 [Trichonephila clavipes]|nr:hypothetical protein TNCV_1394031 [Trichonephila clavipes]
MVIIKEDNLPSCQWSLGRINNIYPGKDSKHCELTVPASKTYRGVRLPNIMPPHTRIPLPSNSLQVEIVEVEIEVVSPSIVPSGNFAELNRTVTCMALKTNDRRTSCPCHDEFRGPRSDNVRQSKGHTRLDGGRKDQFLQDCCRLFTWKFFFQTQQKHHEQDKGSLSTYVDVHLISSSDPVQMWMFGGDLG